MSFKLAFRCFVLPLAYLLPDGASLRAQSPSPVITPEMSAIIWREPNLGTMTAAGEQYYYRKLQPGDVLFIHSFLSNKANRKASVPPAIEELTIPIRTIGPSAHLKNYEKVFLLACFATHSQNTWATIPTATMAEKDYRDLWNYVCGNLYVFKRSGDSNSLRIQINWTDIARLPATNAFGPLLATPGHIGYADVLLDYRGELSINQFLDNAFIPGITNGSFYIGGAGSSAAPNRFSYYLYNVRLNGFDYERYKDYHELDSWNIYDWLYYNKPLNTDYTVNNITSTIYLKFYRYGCRYRIIDNGSTPGSQIVYDPANPDDFLHRNTRTLNEKDLLNIPRNLVRKVIIK
jgi:hypothetical protein